MSDPIDRQPEQPDYTVIWLHGYYKGKDDAQAELIRCRDCRHMVKGQDVDTKEYFYNCNFWQADTVPSGYCHEAEEEGEAE